jgi:lipoyl(octanoyl) transferase
MEEKTLQAVWLGRTLYDTCWTLQKELLRKRQTGSIGDTLLLTEHEPVYTIGSSGNPNHVLANNTELLVRGIPLVAVDRGGDVTYHGPGQIVGYPILDLHDYYLDLHRYLRDLEEVVIRVLLGFGLRATRHPDYTGVWMGDEKICAIGVRVSRWVTMHGFALNVWTELAPFDRIIPCGLREKGVTSVTREIHRPMSIEELIGPLLVEFSAVFHTPVERCSLDDLRSGRFRATSEQPIGHLKVE